MSVRDRQIDRTLSACPLGRAVLLAALCLIVPQASGSGGSVSAAGKRSTLERQVAARGLDPAALVYPDRLTDEMRQWLRRRLPPRPNPRQQVYRLLEMLVGPDGLGLRYADDFTGTAQEVFSSGRYNCLSLSHLIVAFARELGAEASYLAVGSARRLRMEDDLMLVSRHVTAGFGVGSRRQIVKLNVVADLDYETAMPMSDLKALALYYANRGAEMIRTGDLRSAERWLNTAARLEPDLAGAWVNLGVSRRRLGDIDGAVAAYLRALQARDDFQPAYRNLAKLYRLAERAGVAERILDTLDRKQNRDPFSFLVLGDRRKAQGRLDEAQSSYRRALGLSAQKAEARAALGMLALQQGRVDVANRWLARASAEDPQVWRVRSLAAQLARGQGSATAMIQGSRAAAAEQ